MLFGSDVNWSESLGGKPVNINGDESVGTFYHLEGEFNYKLFGSLFCQPDLICIAEVLIIKGVKDLKMFMLVIGLFQASK